MLRNAVQQCRARPGADLGSGSDHVPVFAKIKLKQKKVRRRKSNTEKGMERVEEGI